MLGKLGWRLFVAAMLLLGVFAVLIPEGDKTFGGAQDVVAVCDLGGVVVIPSCATVANPALLQSYAESRDCAGISQTILEKAPLTHDLTCAAEIQVANQDKIKRAANDWRAFPLLNFQC